MRTFEEILDIAAERKGGRSAVLDGIDPPRSASELADVPDDRWLAAMTRHIFNAGFNWRVIEAKWPGFEEAFGGFEIDPIAAMPEDRFDALLVDTRIVRHGVKINAVLENARFIQQVSRESAGFGRRIGGWPPEDYAGLLQWLGKNGARLGGTTAQYFLRHMGVESYVLSRDVVARLIAEGVIDKPPTSQKARAAVQEAFNTWRAESDQPLTVISRVLAQSIG